MMREFLLLLYFVHSFFSFFTTPSSNPKARKEKKPSLKVVSVFAYSADTINVPWSAKESIGPNDEATSSPKKAVDDES